MRPCITRKGVLLVVWIGASCWHTPRTRWCRNIQVAAHLDCALCCCHHSQHSYQSWWRRGFAMKEKGLKCHVELHLSKVEWIDSKGGANLQLKGGPVFLRVCLMGQLRYSDIKVPAFPVALDLTTRFERIFTNCRDPSLIQEVLRGEHVRIELIQVNEDYKGGRIIARYEAPAPSFLFPQERRGSSEATTPPTVMQTVAMNKSRTYESPPVLHFSTMTSVSEATIQSPIDAIWMEQHAVSSDQSSLGGEGQVPTNHAQQRPMQKQPDTDKADSKDYLSAQKESHSGRPASLMHLSSGGGAVGGPLIRSMLRPDGLSDSSQDSTPGVLHTSLGKDEANSESKVKPAKQVRYKPKKARPLQQADAQSLSHTGPHCYECCPRKTTTDQSLSSQREDFDSSNCQSFVESRPVAKDGRPPFVVRHVTEDLISKRDFPRKLTQSHPYSPGAGYLSPPSAALSGVHRSVYTTNASSSQPSSTRPLLPRQQPTFSELYENYLLRSAMMNGEANAKKLTHSTHHKARSLPSSPRTVTVDQLTYTPHPPSTARQSLHSSVHRNTTLLDSSGVGDLNDSGLREQAGNMRQGRSLSPSQAIRERIGRLMEECCKCTHHTESIGEDNLSGEVERLRASLAAERELLNQSYQGSASRKSATVKISDSDYWSDRMAEYTGKPNRVVFDETLERAYKQLYDNSANIR